MKKFIELTKIEFKQFLREPIAFFWVLVFPTGMFLLFGTIYGKYPIGSGFRVVDVYLPCLIAMVIANVGILSIPISIAQYRETKILMRLQATTLKPETILASQILTHFIAVIAGTFILIITGKLIYNIKFVGNILIVSIIFCLSCASFFSFGFMLSSVSPTARSTHALGTIIFFPMLFLSGASIPKEQFPMVLQKVAKFIPLTHVVDMLKKVWIGNNLDGHTISIIVLLAMLGICTFISIRTFRWK